MNKKNVGGLSVSGKGLYIDDQNCPHLVNLNEDPLMTECLVYFLAPGQTVVGSDVGDEDGKAACHSDFVSDETAQQMQLAPGETLVELRTEEAHNLPKHDPVI